MAEKLLRVQKKKIAAKKTTGGQALASSASDSSPAGRARAPREPDSSPASMRPPREIVLVGTYKEKQLAWIKRNGVYNYPAKDGDEFDAESFAKIKELWLYADAKGSRRCFSAEFVGKMPREEFLASYPTYANLGRGRSPSAPNGRAASMKPPSAQNSKLSVLVKSENRQYYVFKTTFLDYGPKLGDPDVLIRAMDFATGRGRARLVKKAYEQYKADGEFAPLAAYLPTELSQVPHERLRVCEAAVQLNFFGALVVPPKVSSKITSRNSYSVISMFSGAMGLDNGIERAGMNIRLCVEFQHAMAETIRANKMICMRRCA